jgi:hypothetical protein
MINPGIMWERQKVLRLEDGIIGSHSGGADHIDNYRRYLVFLNCR